MTNEGDPTRADEPTSTDGATSPSGRKLVLPDGSQLATDPSDRTQRGRERTEEDERFVPVIVKRTDEIRRHPDDVLTSTIREGLEQLERPAASLMLSAVAAGLILGFSAMAAAIATVAASDAANPLAQRIATAVVYPLGFVLCVVSGTELFTEHTATAVYPVLDRRSSASKLFRLWGLVAGGNLIGAMASSALLLAADDTIGANAGYVEIGRHLTEYPARTLFVSAVLAGWLMALGAWLIAATPPAMSQIISIYIVTFLIGFGGLHHSIAGSVEIFAAWGASTDLSAWEMPRFIGIALVGNTVGGSVFVAVLNWAHIRKSRESADPLVPST